MSLSFAPTIEHSGGVSHGIQVAEIYDVHSPESDIKDQIIYYHSHLPINLRDEIDPEELYDLAGQLSNVSLEELNLDMSINKIIETEDALLNQEIPTNKLQKRLYFHMKQLLDQKTSRCFEVQKELRSRYRIRPLGPLVEDQCNRIYIFGPSGSGKSTSAANYAIRWLEDHPGQKVFLFSRKQYDKVFDEGVPNLHRVILDKDFVARHRRERENLETYQNSLCIFDDFTKIEDPAIKDAIMKLKNGIFELGRSLGIDCISIQHKGLGGKESQVELLECNMILTFPEYAKGEIERVLAKYLYMKKTTIEHLLKHCNSRFMCIIRPNVYVDANSVKIIDV